MDFTGGHPVLNPESSEQEEEEKLAIQGIY